MTAAENQSHLQTGKDATSSSNVEGWGGEAKATTGGRAKSGFPDPRGDRNQTQASSYYLEFTFSKASYLIV